MDGMSMTTLLVLTGVCVGTYLILARVVASSQDAREPPLVTSSVPFVGHVIGLMRSKFNYYVQLRYHYSYLISISHRQGFLQTLLTNLQPTTNGTYLHHDDARPKNVHRDQYRACASDPEAAQSTCFSSHCSQVFLEDLRL